ncbi:MAG: hypothetical protein KDA80_08340, partial [Planctomycetaceae bacterium]|nr:hypothetical protein [Planctomycetaceae bacterium]
NAPSQGYSSIVSLAPNGSYLAGTLAGNKQIEVYDLKADKSLGILQTDSSGDFQISQLAVWADRLVAVSNIHNGIKVWDLPSGQLKHDIKAGDKFNPDYGHAFSPSGKYLAVDGEFLKKQIDFYDLADGKVVGSISPEGETRVGEIEAMGFSQEGDKFAAIYGVDIFSAPARKYSRVVVWDLKTGKLSSDFELEPKLKDQLDPVYQNHFMESLPGTNRWLVQSQGIVDADEQQLVLAFPKQQGVDLNPSRKVMEPNTVAAVITEKGDPRIELETFSQEDLLAGAASAAAGGMASDAGLPPLTPSDFTEAREALASNEWAAPVDGLRTTPIRDSIRVASDGTARDIAISRSESPVIVIRVGIGENSNDPAVQAYQKTLELLGGSPLETKAKQPFAKESELSAFDASGKELGKVTIPYSAQLWSVSPNGQLAVLEQHETNGRLDIYQLQESGEHIVGWRPYRAESEERHREIKRVEFIDNQTVATLSMNYQLVVWNVPQAKPLWRLNEVRDFELTPGGKALIAVRGNILGGKSLAVFESRTGEGWGGVELDGATKSLAFHPNGQLLAISRDSGADKLLRIVDFETGETVEEFPIPAIATSISWTGDEFLLLNTSQLVNRKLQAVVWSYSSGPVQFPLAQVNTQPTFLQLAGNRAVVRTVDVPSETVAGRLDPAQLRDQAILKPGDPVKLRTSIASEPKLLSLRNVAEELVSRQLEAAGSKVGDSDIELAVTGSIVSEGNATVSKIGDRSVSETVMRKTIVLDFTYSKGGKPLWTSTRRVGNLDQFLVRLQQGQTAQEGIDQQMAERAQGVLRSMKLPSFIFGEQAARGLGTSSLVE